MNSSESSKLLNKVIPVITKELFETMTYPSGVAVIKGSAFVNSVVVVVVVVVMVVEKHGP
jgi:hypothetical protein